MQEKRQHLRTAFGAEVTLTHPALGERRVAMRDMSDGGIFILIGDQSGLEMGDVVQVQAVDLEDAPLLSARVVRIESSGVGLMFIDL